MYMVAVKRIPYLSLPPIVIFLIIVTMLRLLYCFSVLISAIAFSPVPTTSSDHQTSTALKMSANEEVKAGDTLPSVILSEGQADYGKPKEVNLSELIAGKKVAIFAVPGVYI